MTEPRDADARLDSWKVIAAHLGRDERTVRRWELELGFPVRRLPGGRGRSVYAYTSEIEAWLTTAGSEQAAPVEAAPIEAFRVDAAPRDEAPSAADPSRRRSPSARRWLVAAGIAALAGAAAAWTVSRRILPGDVRVKATPEGVVAYDLRGVERWRYPFAPEYRWALGSLDMIDPAVVAGGTHPALFVATTFRQRKADAATESGTLFRFSLGGADQGSFSFSDTVTIHGSTLGPPWAITSFAIDGAGNSRRIAVVAHHYVWNASLVTVLDERMRRQATWVHDGWIESVRWIAPNRILVAGFSNPHDGGMLALIDPTITNAARLPAAEAPGDCDLCPAAALVRMVILPRTELNRATTSPFNRALISLDGGRIMARTAEMPLATGGFVDAVYEFTPALDLVSAAYSDAYRERVRALTSDGKMHAARRTSDAPPEVQLWAQNSGWRTVRISAAR